MKKTIIIAVLAMFGLTAAAQSKTEQMNVSGNCGMCKKVIEVAAKKVDGVNSVNWDVKSKIATFTYDAKKTNKAAIAKAIAGVGYDNELVKADDKVYNKLHSCCKYDRKPKSE